MKLLMFSGGMDSTYLAWNLLSTKTPLDLHYISIRNDTESIWKQQDIRTKQIVEYFKHQSFDFNFTKSKFELFGYKSTGFDSDLILLVAQKIVQNYYDNVDVLLGWNPYDMKRPIIADRAKRHVTSNIWKALVESTMNRDFINKELQFPLIEQNITKIDMMKAMPNELLDLTWSCRKGGDEPCNKCHSCRERNAAVKNLP